MILYYCIVPKSFRHEKTCHCERSEAICQSFAVLRLSTLATTIWQEDELQKFGRLLRFPRNDSSFLSEKPYFFLVE